MKALIINGPNLNMLGKRDKNHYGDLSLEMLNKKIVEHFSKISFDFFQSNHEGEIIDLIQNIKDYDFLIINPGGLAHYSVSLRDAFEMVKIPKGVCHLSNLSKRESFRQIDLLKDLADEYVSGKKENSYLEVIEKIVLRLREEE